MITLTLCNDKNRVEQIYRERNIEKNKTSCLLEAKDRDRLEGFCLFDIDGEKIVIRDIEPQKDLFLADGVLRSALHVAAERFIFNAFYAHTVPEEFFRKLGFIKSETDKTLDIDKLFKSCQSCGKES